MFLSALFNFIMYTLIFFRLRGNILVHGRRITFRFRQDTSMAPPKSVDTHVINIAKGMLLWVLFLNLSLFMRLT